MKFIKKMWNLLLGLENIILFVASFALVILIFGSVIMRYVLKMNYVGLEEITTLIGFWIYFIGGAKCSYEESHISADMISIVMHDSRGKRLFILIRAIITAGLLALATYYSFDLVAYALSSGTSTTSLHLPLQYMYISIPVGLILMTLYAAYHVALKFGKVRNFKNENDENKVGENLAKEGR